MGLRVTTQPAFEPVSLADAKVHLHYDADDQDDRISLLISAARGACEIETNRAICRQGLTLTMEEFPGSCEEIELPRSPLQSVQGITYYDCNGDLQTMAASEYRVDISCEPGLIMPARLACWPCVDEETPNAVSIVYVAGWLTEQSVPAEIRQSVLLLVGHWFDNLAAVVTGTIATEIPYTVKMLLTHWKLPVIA